MTPRHRTSRVCSSLCAAAVVASSLLVACADGPPAAPPPQTNLGLRGPGVGITVNRWIVDDNPFDDHLSTGEAPRTFGPRTRPLAEVLAPYLNRAVPVNKVSRERWIANGLRVVMVPRADLDAVRESLRLVGPVQQQWVGESHNWMELVHGPAWTGVEAVTLDDGALTLGSGSLRLLMRCWIGPALPTMVPVGAPKLPSGAIPGAVQVELVPQHVAPVDREDIAVLLRPKPTVQGAGVILPRLSIEGSFASDDVMLIVPERPDAQWKPRAALDDAQPAGEPGAGPPLPSAPTVGELMMTDLALGARRNIRMILVIEPMPPRTFNLLGR